MANLINQNFLLEKKSNSEILGLPRFLILLAFTELWERFSYYGMRALLVLYLTTELGFADRSSYAIYSSFAAMGYAGPVIFGILADRFFGFKYMILIGAIIMALGHSIMALGSDWIYLGLSSIAIGTGAFKGNITNLLGECYSHSGYSGREKGFTIFYVAINIGSALASILCAFVAKQYGWHYGFATAGIGMIIGLVTFIFFMKGILSNFGNPPINISTKKIYPIKAFFLVILGLSILVLAQAFIVAESFNYLLTWFAAAGMIYYVFNIVSAPSSDERIKLIVVLIYIFALLVFFALEMQLGSLINLFTARNVDRVVFGYEIPAGFFQAINPLSVIFFGVLLSSINNSPKFLGGFRLSIGILTMSASFGFLCVSCFYPNAQGQISYLSFVLSLSFMGIGEVVIAPFVISQVALLSPDNKKGFLMGMLMLAVSFSNILGTYIVQYMEIPSVNGEVNTMESLVIYRDGFLNIALWNLVFVAIFPLLSPIIRMAYRNSSTINSNNKHLQEHTS